MHRYSIPESEHMAQIEAALAAGEEHWTQRAIGALSDRFTRSKAGKAALKATCQRLETVFRHGGRRAVRQPESVALLSEIELANWTAFGDTYLVVRESAFRAMLTQQASRQGEPAHWDALGKTIPG